MKPTGDPGPIGLGKSYRPVAIGNSMISPPATCMVACNQPFTVFSVCFKNRISISITHACPLCFLKGHVLVDVICARSDAIWVLKHLCTKTKKSKLPMQDPYGFETPQGTHKGLARGLYDYLKSQIRTIYLLART